MHRDAAPSLPLYIATPLLTPGLLSLIQRSLLRLLTTHYLTTHTSHHTNPHTPFSPHLIIVLHTVHTVLGHHHGRQLGKPCPAERAGPRRVEPVLGGPCDAVRGRGVGKHEWALPVDEAPRGVALEAAGRRCAPAADRGPAALLARRKFGARRREERFRFRCGRHDDGAAKLHSGDTSEDAHSMDRP